VLQDFGERRVNLFALQNVLLVIKRLGPVLLVLLDFLVHLVAVHVLQIVLLEQFAILLQGIAFLVYQVFMDQHVKQHVLQIALIVIKLRVLVYHAHQDIMDLQLV